MDTDELNRALVKVPHYMHEGLLAYLNGQPPSDFLRAILENDLHKAALRADQENQNALFGWACVLDVLPLSVWGNKKKVDAHIETMSQHQNV